MHHYAIGINLVYPARALARRVIQICCNIANVNALVCAYWDKIRQGNVTNNNIRFAMKFNAVALDYQKRGINSTKSTPTPTDGEGCAPSSLHATTTAPSGKWGDGPRDWRHSWNTSNSNCRGSQWTLQKAELVYSPTRKEDSPKKTAVH